MGGGGVRRLGWRGAIRERLERDDLAYGEYALNEEDRAAAKGEAG